MIEKLSVQFMPMRHPGSRFMAIGIPDRDRLKPDNFAFPPLRSDVAASAESA